MPLLCHYPPGHLHCPRLPGIWPVCELRPRSSCPLSVWCVIAEATQNPPKPPEAALVDFALLGDSLRAAGVMCIRRSHAVCFSLPCCQLIRDAPRRGAETRSPEAAVQPCAQGGWVPPQRQLGIPLHVHHCCFVHCGCVDLGEARPGSGQGPDHPRRQFQPCAQGDVVLPTCQWVVGPKGLHVRFLHSFPHRCILVLG